MSSFDPTTIIFAVLTLFVVWKLRSILGARVDVEKRDPVAPPHAAGAGPIQGGAPQPRAAGDVASAPQARAGLAAIAAADRSFDGPRFIEGVKYAYAMIVKAFAAGEVETLRPLLSADVLANFTQEIERRRAAGERAEIEVVGYDQVQVQDARLENGVARIAARIEAKLKSCVRDATGAVLHGDPDLVVTSVEIWTFERQAGASDPNWRLIATQTVSHA